MDTNRTGSFRASELKPFLEEMEAACDQDDRRDNDPVELVWAYDRDEDREIVAFITATMAYGQVAVLKSAVSRVLELLGPAPAEFLRSGDLNGLRGPLHSFVYRMTRGDDVFDLLHGLQTVLNRHGSIEALYLAHDGTHIDRMSGMIQEIRAGRVRNELARGLKYLLTDPADGSTAKRMHLFTRWMVRGPDPVDLGIWKRVPASVLLMPLDTHTSRICRYLGLTDRKSNDLKTVREITAGLAELDPADPLRFDFAICHLGMSKQCIHKWSPDHCPNCPIEPVCRIAASVR